MDGTNLQYLLGRVEALETAMSALIASHPDRQLLAELLERILSKAQTGVPNEPAFEELRAGFQETSDNLTRIAQVRWESPQT